MNSLNLLSSRVMGRIPATGRRPRAKSSSSAPSSPTALRRAKAGEAGPAGEAADADAEASDDQGRGRSYSADNEKAASATTTTSTTTTSTLGRPLTTEPDELEPGQETPVLRIPGPDGEGDGDSIADEKKPLLDIKHKLEPVARPARWRALFRRLVNALTALLAALGTPVVYLARLFKRGDGSKYDDDDDDASSVSPLPHRRRRQQRREQQQPHRRQSSTTTSYRSLHPSYSSESLISSSGASESDDSDRRIAPTAAASAINPAKRASISREPRRSSIRIKEQTDGGLQPSTQRRRRRQQQLQEQQQTQQPPLTVDNIKSPTSPSSLKVTRYPHQPRPPRPLTPRRQPSYSTLLRPSSEPHHHNHNQQHHQHQQKTLVLDLDETLIHSLARGGRMSSGHMVEVRLNTPVAVAVSSPPPPTASGTGTPPPPPPTQVIGPQHPILYYVHKRPHCEEFLKKVCKWYKLVIFTASVQEYADPVIDWLEQERKYFAGRYYRQHCTFRNGAYIKDLGAIEPDLSKVLILDNSPVSYIFHPDNAIPIEGWISDPSDNDLLHLIPMLEALQYVPDVRALLALRRGETAETAASSPSSSTSST